MPRPSFLLPLVLFVAACSGPAADSADTAAETDTAMDGGGCTYAEQHGTCTFVDAVGGAQVTFDYVSDDGSVTETYTLYVGDGGTPPSQACLDELGVAPGVSVGCTRGAIETGTCSPVVYAFDTFDTNDCLD